MGKIAGAQVAVHLEWAVYVEAAGQGVHSAPLLAFKLKQAHFVRPLTLKQSN